MIEATHTILIEAGIENVWEYAHDIRKWADLMPGLQSCTIIDADNSRWTMQVGAGRLVRTANVLVRVHSWDGPERVIFTYDLEGDPVVGGGTYTAVAKTEHQTEVQFQVRVEGSGPLAPMWETMGRPLLPKLTRSFAQQFKTAIEKTTGAHQAAQSESPPEPESTGKTLRNLWHKVFDSKEEK